MVFEITFIYFDIKNIKPIPAAVKECLFCRKSASTYVIILICMPNGRDDILFYAATAIGT